jgi:hypothetical protein
MKALGALGTLIASKLTVAVSSRRGAMSCEEWVQGPFGLDAGKGRTFRYQRTVLMVVHSVTAGYRIADVAPLLESDRRIQVTWTRAPSLFSAGVRDFLRSLGGVAVPWRQAIQSRFDMAVAASHGSLEQVHAPVLVVPHGVGFSKYPSVWPGSGPAVRRELRETDCDRLIYHGRVVPARIAVATDAQLERLQCECPPAAAVTAVAGDPCLDRLVASMPLRHAYRTALGTGRRTLVAVSSTWGPGSLLEQCPELLPRLAAELPRGRYQLAAIAHPNVWQWHGRRQVTAWYADSIRRGLLVLPPEQEWRSVVAAADVLIGDHGSVPCYAAAAGIPVVLAVFPAGEVDPRSQVAYLAKAAPRLRLNEPIAPQLDRAAMAWCPELYAAINGKVTSAPGQSARIIRTVMYQLMGLSEPTSSCAAPEPVPVPGAGLAEASQ